MFIDNDDTIPRHEVEECIEKWFKHCLAELAQSHHSTASIKIEQLVGLLDELRACGENGEFPWEVLNT